MRKKEVCGGRRLVMQGGKRQDLQTLKPAIARQEPKPPTPVSNNWEMHRRHGCIELFQESIVKILEAIDHVSC